MMTDVCLQSNFIYQTNVEFHEDNDSSLGVYKRGMAIDELLYTLLSHALSASPLM